MAQRQVWQGTTDGDGGWNPGGEGGLEITSENMIKQLISIYGKTIPVANLVSKVGVLIPKTKIAMGKSTKKVLSFGCVGIQGCKLLRAFWFQRCSLFHP